MKITWLSYLAKDNPDRRERSALSLVSAHRLAIESGSQLIIVDNSEVDNNECIQLRDRLAPHVPVFKAANEWRDVAVHYVALFEALKASDPHLLYTYDDFVFYDVSHVDDAKLFLEQHNVDACRLPRYEVNNPRFNVAFTPKNDEPDSVRHSTDVTHRATALVQDGPHLVGSSEFYVSNWLANSRPMIWKTESFAGVVDAPASCPTFQTFERHLYDSCHKAESWRSGFVNGGWCYTFPQQTSRRIGTVQQDPLVNLASLPDALNDRLRWR